MDLGRKAAARAAKSLAVLPPFEPAADTCARAVVESSICTRWAVELVAASASNMASNTPDRLSRQKRFQTAFQSPNSAGAWATSRPRSEPKPGRDLRLAVILRSRAVRHQGVDGRADEDDPGPIRPCMAGL